MIKTAYYRSYNYQTVDERKAKADQAIKRLKKKNPDIEPVIIEGRKLAKNWWGKSWNKNLESYADFSNRIGRGRSYVRNRAVLDLKIYKGTIDALVQGSRKKPYDVTIEISTLSRDKWEQITTLCNNRVPSMETLIHGKFPVELKELFTDKKFGLFPSPDEITFECSCPDWAYMCKHVAAVLYGIGSRLDNNPLLFFELRGVDGKALIKKTMDDKLKSMLKNASKKSHREIDEKDLSDIFGL